MQIRKTALGKGAQKIQRGRRLIVGAQQPLRIRLPGRLGELDTVDDIAAIARKLHAIHRFCVRRAGLGELPGHAADLHNRQGRAKGQGHRHLQQHTESVSYVIGVEFGEAFRAIPALQQESVASRDLRQGRLQVARLAREN
jgi:hypothetical protein